MHPDLVEGWVFCRRAFEGGEGSDFWPLAGDRSFFDALHAGDLILA